MPSQILQEINQNDKIAICIQANVPEHTIKRVGFGTAWSDVTLSQLIWNTINSHRKEHEVEDNRFKLEAKIVKELEDLIHGHFHIVSNGYVIEPDSLDNVKLGDLVSRTDEDPGFRYGIHVKVEKTEPPKKPVSKYDLLKEDLQEEVDNLHLVGLFVGNLLAKGKMDARVFEFLPGKTVNDLITKANRLMKEKDYSGALEIYTLFAKVYPKNSDYIFLCGKAYLCLGEDKLGIEALKQASSLGHEKADSIIASLKEFHRNYGVLPPSEQLEFFF